MRIRSRVVRGAGWLGLFLAVGYEVAVAASGTILVTVFRGSVGVPAQAARVTIVGSPTLGTTNVNGKATLTAAAGTHQVRATMIGFCSATATVVVTEGQTTNVTLVVGAAPCSGTGSSDNTGGTGSGGSGGTDGTGSGGGGGGGSSAVDRVSTGGTQPLYALVDIRTGAASCENDRLIEGTAGVADLLVNALTLSDPGVTCHGAAWVFTEHHAPWYSNTAGIFPWTNATGDVLTTPLPAGRLRVPVTFWLSDPSVNATVYTTKLTSADLPGVENFLLQNRTGLRLTNSDAANTPPDIMTVSPKVGTGCADTPTIIASTTAYRVDHLNVYVLGQLPDGHKGINCREYGAANVIFLDDDEGYATLVHEIGHALGLSRPQWGHADKQSGMRAGNFMSEGADAPIHATLGQISRMHVDTTSWLNKPSGTGTVRSRQPAFSLAPVTACSCPGTAPTDDCPRLDADIARSGALSTPPLNPACHITAVPPCLSLLTGGTGTVTAKGSTDNTGGTPGSGTQIVASLTPALASAVVAPSAAGSVKASVTAKTTPGDAKILLSIGGNMIGVPVKIGSPCPP